METVSKEEAIPQIQERLEALFVAQTELTKLQAEAQTELNQIHETYGDLTDPLVTLSEQLVDEIMEIFTAHRAHILDEGRKSVVFRGGELSARFATEALEVDEKLVEKALRRLGLWRKYSKPQPRKFDRANFKKDKALIEKLPDRVARLVRHENLIIKLPKLNLEIKRQLNPLRTRLSKSSSD